MLGIDDRRVHHMAGLDVVPARDQHVEVEAFHVQKDNRGWCRQQDLRKSLISFVAGLVSTGIAVRRPWRTELQGRDRPSILRRHALAQNFHYPEAAHRAVDSDAPKTDRRNR
jgi:hypothetical protein